MSEILTNRLSMAVDHLHMTTHVQTKACHCCNNKNARICTHSALTAPMGSFDSHNGAECMCGIMYKGSTGSSEIVHH